MSNRERSFSSVLASILMIAREQIVGSGVADGLGDVRIAGDGVDGDDGAFEAAAGGEFLEQHRDGGRFVGLVVDRLLSDTGSLFITKASNRMQRRSSLGPVVAAAHGLAVDDDHVERIRQAGADPVDEAGDEQIQIDPVHHDVEQRPEGTPQSNGETAAKLEIIISPISDRFEAVTLGDRRANAQQQISFSFEPRLPDTICPRSGKSSPTNRNREGCAGS